MFAVLSPEIMQMTVKEEKLERWKAYMESNMKNWVEYAEQKTIINGAKFKPDDFVFVRGCTKTNQWVRATFEGAGDFTLEIDTSDWYYGSTLKQGGKDISDDWLVGETSESNIHCLALQGLRYEREGFWAPKKIVAGAEPRDSPRDDSDRRLDELIRAGTSRAAVGYFSMFVSTAYPSLRVFSVPRASLTSLSMYVRWRTTRFVPLPL